MRRRRVLRSAGAMSAGSVLFGRTASAGGGGDESREGSYRNPVFEPTFADPSIVRGEEYFYAYGTSDDWHDGEGFRHGPVIRSRDLVQWEYVGELFDELPGWLDDPDFLWAPDVVRYDDRYYVYYSLVDWGEPPGIGIATADDPEGPFEDHGKLFDSEGIGVPNSIDPQLFVDDGTPYLFWGSFEGIYGIELAADGLDTAGEKFRVAGDLFEGVYVVKRRDRYYVFVSSGSCCKGNHSTYQVEVGRSDSLRGPYLNEHGRDLLYSHGRLVVDSDETWAGPGHNALVTDDEGTDWLVYHAYDRDEPWIGEPDDDFGGGEATPRRPLVIDPLAWHDGWPAVEGLAPSTEQRAPAVRW